MTKIQYINKAEELIAELDADVVPERNQWVLIDGDEYHVYHIAHTIEDGQHIVTVFCWDPTDDWDGKEVGQLMADTVRQTLATRLQKERERQLQESDPDDDDADDVQMGAGPDDIPPASDYDLGDG